MEGSLLWFLNRGTGAALLLMLTLATLLGAISTRGNAGGRVPRFLLAALHRKFSLLAVALLGVHVATAVMDDYVDIRWWQALVPMGATYEPVWLGLGTLALDVLAVVVLTSLVRHRLGHRAWRLVHVTAYVAWGLAVLHGIGIGTDAREGWLLWPTVAAVALVGAAGAVRLLELYRRPADAHVRPATGSPVQRPEQVR